MKLTEIKKALTQVDQISFRLPDGSPVPSHFHVTEIGSIHKHFIDCGGTIRSESAINFQLFTATDYDHRLSASKLKAIIELSEEKLGLTDLEIEVEYQGDTIGKYGLKFDGQYFQLTNRKTDCLARDHCGFSVEKPRVRISTSGTRQVAVCKPGLCC
jgi:hypothetical protein